MKNFILLTTLLFLVFPAYFYLAQERQFIELKTNGIKKTLYFKNIPISQIGRRKIIEKKIKKILEFGGVKDTSLFYPIGVIVDDNENVYVLDQIGRCVKKFDQKGIFLTKYGRQGQGPGELELPVRHYFDSENNLYVYDKSQRKVVCYKSNATEFHIKGGTLPMNFLPLDSKTMVLLRLEGNSLDLLEKYSMSGEKILNYERILYEDSKSKNYFFMGYILTGEILRVSSSNFIYVPYFLNQIFIFNNDKIEKVITTIDDPTKLKYELDFRPQRKLIAINNKQVENKHLYYRAFIVGEELQIVCKKESMNKPYIITDIYNLSNLKYKYSYKIEYEKSINNITNIYFKKNKIYITTDDARVEVYTYQ